MPLSDEEVYKLWFEDADKRLEQTNFTICTYGLTR